MVSGNDLIQFFAGGTKAKEFRETQRAWKTVEALWRTSPLATRDVDDLAGDIVREALVQTGRVPSAAIIGALQDTAEELLRGEPVGALDVYWNVIENDVEAALGFRQMMQRRIRWSEDFECLFDIARRQIVSSFSELLFALPESCFEGDGGGDVFELPLIDLLSEPARTIERMLRFPYDDGALSSDLFRPFRETYERNLLVASGLSPFDDPQEHIHKLKLPTAQRGKSPAELASIYLDGTPLQPLMELAIPLRLSDTTRFEHCHIIGGTGHGKTQLLQKMIHADLLRAQQERRSVVVIDSQGDLINKLVRLDLFSPDALRSLADRLILIDPSDVEYPVALNLFDAHLDRMQRYSRVDRERILNGVIELYELFFGAFLGAELTQKQGVIFKYLARLILQIPHATIYTLMQIMEDGKRFKPCMAQLDGSARYFFETEFFHPSFAATKKQILRRLWGVLSTPAFERMLAQPTCKLDLFEALNDGKIILINTAKDLLKRDGSQLLGRFFVAMIAQAALERSTVPEARRTPTFVYIDEAHEYFDDSVETILNQARKYRVGMTLAHQTLDQLSAPLRATILANTSIKCVGGVSAKDARVLADELHTDAEFVQGMRRRGTWTDFAVWVKHVTPQAIRLSVPLGFLERQPATTEESYDSLISRNRDRYCGTLADVSALMDAIRAADASDQPKAATDEPPPAVRDDRPVVPPETIPAHKPDDLRPRGGIASPRHAVPTLEVSSPARTLGKGGEKHKYLQSLIKELAEAHGLRAVIEAPLPGGGQADVLIEHDGILAAVEISVTTPVEHERENVAKCLAADVPRVAVVLAKTKATHANYKAGLMEAIPPDVRERVSFLTPEELPDYIASLGQPSASSEQMMKGYRVKTTVTTTSPEATRARQHAVGQLIARSLAQKKD